MRESYNRPKARLLRLKAQMAKSEVTEPLLYGCAKCTPLKVHYKKFPLAHNRYCFEPSESSASCGTTASSPTKTPSNELYGRVSMQPWA